MVPARGRRESRLNFLDLLRAGYTDYVLNDAAYDYMQKPRPAPAATIARLKAGPETRFSDQTAWQAHLDRLGFNALKVTPEPSQESPPRVLLWNSACTRISVRRNGELAMTVQQAV